MKGLLSLSRWRRAAFLWATWVRMPGWIRRRPLAPLLRSIDCDNVPPERPHAVDDWIGLARSLRHRRLLPKATCLIRCLSLYRCLRRDGVPAEIVFAVAPGQKELTDGHCWLEVRGEPVWEYEERMSAYAPVFRYPEEGQS